MSLAYCIGCRCHDEHACTHGADGACSWLVVDYDEARGVCSECEDHLTRWKEGDHTLPRTRGHRPPMPSASRRGTKAAP